VKFDAKVKSFFKAMDPAKAGQAILAGVEKNRPIIVFPTHARLLWWLSRISPSCLNPVGRKFVQDFRKMAVKT
jgi:hypothetical protein